MRENRDKRKGKLMTIRRKFNVIFFTYCAKATTWSLLVGSGCMRSRTFSVYLTSCWSPGIVKPWASAATAASASRCCCANNSSSLCRSSFSRCARFLKAQMTTFKPVKSISKSMLSRSERIYLHLSIFFLEAHKKLSCCAFKVLQKVMKSLQKYSKF